MSSGKIIIKFENHNKLKLIKWVKLGGKTSFPKKTVVSIEKHQKII